MRASGLRKNNESRERRVGATQNHNQRRNGGPGAQWLSLNGQMNGEHKKEMLTIQSDKT